MADQGKTDQPSSLELLKNDSTANAPERDRSAEAPELDPYVLAPEVREILEGSVESNTLISGRAYILIRWRNRLSKATKPRILASPQRKLGLSYVLA